MKRTDIEQLLPGVFQRTLRPGAPLAALLEVIEALHAPDEEVLERLAVCFDPYHAPDEFVPYLAGWVDLDRCLSAAGEPAAAPTFPAGLGRLRELIAAAAFLATWRGTAQGLLRFLETATGVQGFTLSERPPDQAGRPRPFHLGIRAPAAARPYRALVERIVEMEKPAYMTYELAFDAETGP